MIEAVKPVKLLTPVKPADSKKSPGKLAKRSSKKSLGRY